jgi:hypothetical protein
MKGTSILLLGAAAILLLFPVLSCKKKPSSGAVVLTVRNGTQNVPGCPVFMQQGTLQHPGIPTSNFTSSAETNPGGVATFGNLPRDEYFFLAVFIQNGDTLSGSTSVTMGTTRRELTIRIN